MPVKHPTRGQRVSMMRAFLRDPHLLCGPREPVLPLSLVERCRGGEMVHWDARIDLAMTLGKLKVYEAEGLPKSVLKAADSAANAPSAQSIGRVRKLLVAAVNGDTLGDGDARTCIELATSLLFHEGALGCPMANAACSAMSLAQAMRDARVGKEAEAWLALRAAMAHAEDASHDYTDVTFIPEPAYAELTRYDSMAPLLSNALGLVVSAQEAEMVAEDVLRGGAGASAPEWAADDDDLAALADLVDPSPEPTLVVLAAGALDHLPGSSSSSSQSYRGSTPRAEFKDLAGRALPLVHGVDIHAARQVLDHEFPWFEDLTRLLLGDLVGGRYTRLRNTLIVGSPGCGKTRYLRRFCEVCLIPSVIYNAAGSADASYGGTSRQWSTGRANFSLQIVDRTRVANPCVILDELEKTGTRRENGSLTDTLTALLEPEGARAFIDPYIEAPVDLSRVQYLATANTVDGIPAPLRDRLRIVRAQEPRPQDLSSIVATLVPEIRADRGLDEVWMPDLDAGEVDLLGKHWRGGSLRPLRRLVETVLAGRDALALRH